MVVQEMPAVILQLKVMRVAITLLLQVTELAVVVEQVRLVQQELQALMALVELVQQVHC
jgi:hypothetical protein